MYIYKDIYVSAIYQWHGDVGVTPRLPPASLAPEVWYAPGATCRSCLSLVPLWFCLRRLVFGWLSPEKPANNSKLQFDQVHQVLSVGCVCRWFSFGFAFDVLFRSLVFCFFFCFFFFLFFFCFCVFFFSAASPIYIGTLYKSQRTVRDFNLFRTLWSHRAVILRKTMGAFHLAKRKPFGFPFSQTFRFEIPEIFRVK